MQPTVTAATGRVSSVTPDPFACNLQGSVHRGAVICKAHQAMRPVHPGSQHASNDGTGVA